MNRRSVVVVSVFALFGLARLAVACGASSDIGIADVPDGTDATVAVDVATPSDTGSIEDASVDAIVDVDADADADAAPPYVLAPSDVNHILGTGQSLSVGARGTPVLTTMQPYDNQMFNTGVIAGGTTSRASSISSRDRASRPSRARSRTRSAVSRGRRSTIC